MTPTARRSLYIFTNDLRLDDNPALHYALSSDEVSLLYYRDTSSPWRIEGAAAWWLEQNIESLEHALSTRGLTLSYLSGEGINALVDTIEKHGFTEVCIARSYFKHEREMQAQLYQWCKNHGLNFKRFPGTLLFEPESITTQQGGFYKVFTPFYKNSQLLQPRSPAAMPNKIQAHNVSLPSEHVSDWALYPKHARWAEPIAEHWQSGEAAAQHQLQHNLADIVSHYETERNNLSDPATSRLSPYLNLGILSPARAWHDIASAVPAEDAQAWLRQLVWREFNYHLLFHQPDIDSREYQQKFSNFPWKKDDALIRKWQKGQTGYPIVDAAMNELWQSGWMHNRSRMIVASFLTKHLQQHWLSGARWFWHTLIDADLANNTGGWQWTAGCGADAAPYFRIFNPITQGQKFDPAGNYVRQWLPVLKNLPDTFLFEPWKAPDEVLKKAGVRLGENYPQPIVDHKAARERALASYAQLND